MENKNGCDGTDGVEDRPLAKSSPSTRKVFFLDVALGFDSTVMCKQERDEQCLQSWRNNRCHESKESKWEFGPSRPSLPLVWKTLKIPNLDLKRNWGGGEELFRQFKTNPKS